MNSSMWSICRNALTSLRRFWLGSIVAAALLWPLPVFAQVGLSPLVIELEAERGQAEGVLNVINNTNQEFRARIYVEPFTYTPETGFETLSSDPNDLTPYIQFSPRELSVPPNTTRRVRFVSRFPPSLPDGEYRAVIFTENLVEAIAADGAQVALRTRVGATVYVRHGEGLSAELTANSARYNADDQHVQLLVQNTGTASSRVAIAWEIAQGGQAVQSGVSGEASVLPGTERYLTLLDFAESATPLAPGSYQLTGELRWIDVNDDAVTQPFSVEFTLPNS